MQYFLITKYMALMPQAIRTKWMMLQVWNILVEKDVLLCIFPLWKKETHQIQIETESGAAFGNL